MVRGCEEAIFPLFYDPGSYHLNRIVYHSFSGTLFAYTTGRQKVRINDILYAVTRPKADDQDVSS